MKITVNINNAPEEIYHPYVVVRRDDDGKLWYYGAYESNEYAEEVAVRIKNGIVVVVEVDHDEADDPA